MRIVCDNAHHDAGEGVCVFCVQKRVDEAVKAERERCAQVAENTYCEQYASGWSAGKQFAKAIRNSSES